MNFPQTAIIVSLSTCMIFPSGAAFAQTSVTVCESQRSLEQALTTEGGIMPDDCRPITVASLTSEGRELCLMDLSQSDGGVISNLRDVAAPQEWWVLCSDLAGLAVPVQ